MSILQVYGENSHIYVVSCLQYHQCESAEPENPLGPCIKCLQVSQHTRHSHVAANCLRIRITEVSLYPDQKHPSMLWTDRWQSMEMKDIKHWVSDETKTIRVTHGFMNTGYTLRVQQFYPKPGDSLCRAWWDGDTLREHYAPPFAIANMREASQEVERYVDTAIIPSINSLLGRSDALLWETYAMAFKYANSTLVCIRLTSLTTCA